MNALFRFVFVIVTAFSFLAPTISEAKNVQPRKHQKAKKPRAVHKQKVKKHGKVSHKKHRYQGRLGSGSLDGSLAERRIKIALENRIAYDLGLPRFEKLDDIRKAHKTLVRVPDVTPTFFIDPMVDTERRYLQVWTYVYLAKLADDFHREIAMTDAYPALKITSMVRDMEYQSRLPSAAQCQTPERCSTHLTGATFDISFKDMSREQFAWMYKRLTKDRDLGTVNAIHEPWSGCFHIFVIPPAADDAKEQILNSLTPLIPLSVLKPPV